MLETQGAPSKDAPLTNVAAHLPRMAAAQPHAPAIFCPTGRDRRGRVRYTHYTYRQLDEAADRIARGLERHGAGPGTRVALMVRPSLELFATVFGLFKAGCVPVLVDPGLGVRGVGDCLRRAAPELFIGVPAAMLARRALGWGKESVRLSITVGPRRSPFGPTLDAIEEAGSRGGPMMRVTAPEDPAAILFTSGSTGPAKGALYSHGNFVAQVEALRNRFDIRPGEVDLPTFPLFALFDPALGMTTIIPDMDPSRPAKACPHKLVEAIEDFGVTTMFGSPALLDAMSRWCTGMGVRLPTLRRVFSAGAPVPSRTLERMRGLLADDAEVITPYGATECLPVATIESREVIGETAAATARGEGVCVGRPVPEAEVHIIAIEAGPIERFEDARPLPTGEIGEIVVRGPMATTGYVAQPEATRRAKIQDEGGTFWHRMGDAGYLDEAGRLWFCGRVSQRVETEGQTLHTSRIEGVFDIHRDVRRSALVGVGTPARPVVVVELEPKARGRRREDLFQELRLLAEAHASTRGLETFLVHPGLPVDIRHNAKIKREVLATWALGELAR